ncbi:uncharacterized protein LOC143882525 [Tasmannia lanceolata]|uniref:uncharacterized protein LOC143882525 n=1 Tax=Tasmannia lanceolata TaxID=3420 RepID=UPI0040633315
MSSARKAWIVATSIGAVEALKDQGFCRWNYAIRSLNQQAKKKIGSYTQAKRLFSSLDCSAAKARCSRNEKLKAEKAETVMHLICWGPK